MPFNLTASRLVLAMSDLAGDTYDLYYRLPTNAERVAFTNSLYEKKGRKTVAKDNIFAEQVALGKKLCLGFSEGYFMDGDDFISSDKAKPYFRENWKNMLEAARPSDLQQIAIVALKPAAPSGGEAEEESLPEAGEEEDASGEEPQAGTGGGEADEAPLSSSSEAS